MTDRLLTRAPFIFLGLAYLSVVPLALFNQAHLVNISVLLFLNIGVFIALFNMIVKKQFFSSTVALALIFCSFIFSALHILSTSHLV